MFTYRNSTIGTAIVLLFLTWSCSSPHTPVSVSGALLPVDSAHISRKDAAVDSIITVYRSAMEEEMNQVLAHSSHLMQRGTPEGLLNNFVADLIMETGMALYSPEDGKPIDFTLLNYGGLRTTIPEGPVTRARVFELMPFENEMVVLTIGPDKTKDLFRYLAEAERGMPVSGIRIVVTEDNQVKDVQIGSESFDPGRNYKVLTSDYLAGGGDNMNFFLDPVNEELLGKRIRDAIIAYLAAQDEKGKEVSTSLDGRIRIE